MKILSLGLGVNSVALAIEAANRGIVLDLIVFSDTGDERKRTYEYCDLFSEWLVNHGQPAITTTRWIRRDGTFVPISDISLLRKELPSKAYGYSGCTAKWKQQPLDKLVREDERAKAAWARGELVERWIGYDSDEPERAARMLEKNPQPRKRKQGQEIVVPSWKWRCPLVEWDMGREECLAVIAAAGLPSPGKSSCFMCPSMKRSEIDDLARDEPEALQRALAIEDAALQGGELRTVKGLGRSFSWREYLEGKAEALAAREVVEQDCGCFDGDGGD